MEESLPSTNPRLVLLFRKQALPWWLSWWRIRPQCGRPALIPGWGRSPGGGGGDPLQCSGLENSLGCIVHGVAKSRAQLSNSHFHFLFRKQTALSPWFLLTAPRAPTHPVSVSSPSRLPSLPPSLLPAFPLLLRRRTHAHAHARTRTPVT